MRKLFKRVSSWVLIPITQWYLRKKRTFQYGNISLTVLPGVFHPGLFGSSKFLLQYLNELNVSGKTFLDVGTGSGAIAVMAAKRGAIVTAIDLSKIAIENALLNVKQNNVDVIVVHSDLFSNVSQTAFDFIFINPPYYPRIPASEAELAWYCGDNFQYYHKLFSTMPAFIHSQTIVVMVLSKGCDLERIFQIAESNKFKFQVLQEKSVLFDEKNFLYQLTKIN
jgi:release factor glutamine methyltransferase